MAEVEAQGDLFPTLIPPDGTRVINDRCLIRTRDGHRLVMVSGIVLSQYAVGDRMAEAYAMVSLVEQGWADQNDVAQAFGCSVRTVRRHQRRFEDTGLSGLGHSSGCPKGHRRLQRSRTTLINRLKAEGHSNREIARRVGVSEMAVRKLLRRLGWRQPLPEQTLLPLGDASPANPNLSASSSPTSQVSATDVAGAANPNLSASSSPASQVSVTDVAGAADPNLSASSSPVSQVLATDVPGAANPNLSASLSPASQVSATDVAGAANPNLSASSSPASQVSATDAAEAANRNLSAFASAAKDAVPFSMDTDPADRSFDRLMACLGLLDDAAPLFRSGQRVPRAGVLLALPALVQSGVFDCAREIYGSIGPAFYGLRTSILALLLMALWRIKRAEGLKEHPPEDLGRVLGLDRAPEVKTLRRKLSRLAGLGRAVEFGRALAERRVALRGAALGFLYVDGHVRVYHGRHQLPKAHVARMRLSMPATSDYWVNDTAGDPLFVVTAEANAGLVKMLPLVLGEVRALLGERRATVVFDRGGYSPKLFQQIIAGGFDILTYRKGRFRRVPRQQFHEHPAVIAGREVRYTLADQGVRLLGGKLRLRQVTRLSKDGHQTPILTSRRDLSAVQVAFRMFERWRQENFFKYLREEYALDALVDYAVLPDNPVREVPNPAWAAVDAKLREARAELTRLQAEYGRKALGNLERVRATMRGFKIAQGKLGQTIRAAMKRVATLETKRAVVPKRLPVQEVVCDEVVKLAPERKHLTSLLKMVAYQAESDLVRLVAPHYRRVEEEGRTLIQSALSSDADLEVTDRELRITVTPLSSAHRTRAIATLCHELNCSEIVFPGSRLRLHYCVKETS